MRPIILCFMSLFALVACTSQADFGDAITEGEPTVIPTQVIPSRQIFEVQQGDIISQQTYVGRVSAITATRLSFSQDGRIIETFFERGADVVAGDIIASIDTSELDRDLLDAEEVLAVAESLLQSAESQASFARRRAELNVELAQIFLDFATLNVSEPITAEETLTIRQREIELDLAQLALDELEEGINPELQFDVSRAQEDVDRINGLIGETDLIAPIDGRLTTLSIIVGDPVLAFETIAIVTDLSALEVTDVLDSTQLSELTEGMPVTLQPANRPGDTFPATISTLPQPFGIGNDESIHISFDNNIDDEGFTLGDRLSFLVTIDERNDVLWLPPSVIRQFSGRTFVVVQDGTLQQRVDVRLGLESDERVEILEGLEAGQMVIAP